MEQDISNFSPWLIPDIVTGILDMQPNIYKQETPANLPACLNSSFGQLSNLSIDRCALLLVPEFRAGNLETAVLLPV